MKQNNASPKVKEQKPLKTGSWKVYFISPKFFPEDAVAKLPRSTWMSGWSTGRKQLTSRDEIIRLLPGY